jgi:hypothetical protein
LRDYGTPPQVPEDRQDMAVVIPPLATTKQRRAHRSHHFPHQVRHAAQPYLHDAGQRQQPRRARRDCADSRTIAQNVHAAQRQIAAMKCGKASAGLKWELERALLRSSASAVTST